MKYNVIRKTLALGMTLLFLGTIFVSVVSGNTGDSEPALPNKASSNTPGEPSSTTSKTSRTSSTSFVYGPLGNRISSTDANGDTTYYLYEGTNVIQDRQQDGTLTREYVSGVGGKLAMIDYTDKGNKPAGEDEVLYYLHDILGSVVALINTGSAVVERYYYNPYGETIITDSPSTTERSESVFGNTFMWTGKEYDSENELYHFPARTYSPSLGRWLQRDPLGYVDGLNLYEYVCSNPIRFTDPLGLQHNELLETIEGAIEFSKEIDELQIELGVEYHLLCKYKYEKSIRGIRERLQSFSNQLIDPHQLANIRDDLAKGTFQEKVIKQCDELSELSERKLRWITRKVGGVGNLARMLKRLGKKAPIIAAVYILIWPPETFAEAFEEAVWPIPPETACRVLEKIGVVERGKSDPKEEMLRTLKCFNSLGQIGNPSLSRYIENLEKELYDDKPVEENRETPYLYVLE